MKQVSVPLLFSSIVLGGDFNLAGPGSQPLTISIFAKRGETKKRERPQELTILLMQRHQVVLKLAPVNMNKHPDPAARRDKRAGVLPQRGRISFQHTAGKGEEDDKPEEIRPDEGEDVDDERVLARDHGVRLHSVHVEWNVRSKGQD